MGLRLRSLSRTKHWKFDCKSINFVTMGCSVFRSKLYLLLAPVTACLIKRKVIFSNNAIEIRSFDGRVQYSVSQYEFKNLSQLPLLNLLEHDINELLRLTCLLAFSI